MSTVPATTGDNLPATQSPGGGVEGLEDFDISDQVMPTFRIDHGDGVFVDGLSDEKHESLSVVLLGLVKQRILWPAQVSSEKQYPMCRAYDFKEGHPAEDFPWEASGFEKQDGTLPCNSCKLKDWGSHPQRDAPWCSETHTFAALRKVEIEGVEEYLPILLQVQRSGLKPSRTYMNAFQQQQQPLFTVFTNITLDKQRKGSNNYAVPKFSRGEATDESDFPFFSTTYRGIRNFLHTPRTFDTSDDENGSTPVADPAGSGAVAPAAVSGGGIGGTGTEAASQPATQAPAPSEASSEEDEELPF